MATTVASAGARWVLVQCSNTQKVEKATHATMAIAASHRSEPSGDGTTPSSDIGSSGGDGGSAVGHSGQPLHPSVHLHLVPQSSMLASPVQKDAHDGPIGGWGGVGTRIERCSAGGGDGGEVNS